MLQVIIEHYKDETVSIKQIYDDNKLLAEMGVDDVINVDVCLPYCGQTINVIHNYVGESQKNYDLNATLVGVDTFNGLKCIKYVPIEYLLNK